MRGVVSDIELLPYWLRIFAYILPTTSVIDLTRACLSGVFHTRHIYESSISP
jgi:ABC-type multidrug transport system permease subunit